MAIAFDTSAEKNFAPATSGTWAHTITGSDVGITCAIHIGDTADRVSTVKHDGVSLDQDVKLAFVGGRYEYLYSKEGASLTTGGTPNMEVVFTSSTWAGAASESFTGVDQTDMIDGTDSVSTSGDMTLTITTTVTDCWLVSLGTNTNFGAMGAGTGTTKRGGVGGMGYGDSNGAKSGASAHSMQWTAASGSSGGVMVAIKPSAGASPTAFTPSVMMF